jgi:hypothetical protein
VVVYPEQHCERDGVSIEVEAGARVTCEEAGATWARYRALYEERWGVVAFETAGWRVRFRVERWSDVQVGQTVWDAQQVDVLLGNEGIIPHELHHVQIGPTSGQHTGWCSDFEPWEESAVHWDERAYLGCAR